MKTKGNKEDKDKSEVVKILQPILHNFDLSEKKLLHIAGSFKIVELKKGDKFCKIDKACNEIGILLEGVLVANFDTAKGKLNVSRFFYTPDNIIVTNFESFKTSKKSNETITAIENCRLLCIDKIDLEKLYEELPVVNKIGRQFAEDSYIVALQRIHDLQTMNNEERILKFYREKKFLYNKLKKEYIASYLRVNRNDLTKVVSKYTK